MDARNRDELLKKQENLEAYLLENPRSSLFAWYARQNMEAGEIERALQICKLGLMAVKDKGILHKLLGEIYLAKGEVTQSMKHLVKCILTKEPFPGVIIEVIKNLGDTMEAEQLAFLTHLLNKSLPGHPEAIKYYKKYPAARDLAVQPGQYKLMEQLAESLERSAQVEILPVDEDDEMAMPVLPELEAPAPAPTFDKTSPSSAPAIDEDVEIKFVDDDIPEIEIPIPEGMTTGPVVAGPLPEPAAPPKPKEKTAARQAPAVKHNITRSMATFTLMQIFKDQGMYENALEVLQFLKEKSTNEERIESEEKEIRELMEQNSIR